VAMNLLGIIFLYFFCRETLGLDQAELSEKMHAASRLTGSNSRDNERRRFTEEIIERKFSDEPILVNDQPIIITEILPPLERKKVSRNKTRRGKTDHRLKKSSSCKATDVRKSAKKIELKELSNANHFRTIKIPAEYLLIDSQAEKVSLPSLKWSADPVETSSERTMAEKVRYFEGQKKNFTDSMNSYLRSADLRENIIYTYPLFMDDQSFLKTLKSYAPGNELLISELLYTFAIEEFFWRYPSMEAMLQLKSLLNQIKASDPLRHKIWLALDARNRPIKKKSSKFHRRSKEDLYDELESLVPNDHLDEKSLFPLLFLRDRRRIEWSDASYIAQLMTLRDSNLFRSISIPQIILWIKEDGKGDNERNLCSILDLNAVLTKTVNFLTFLLICQESREARLNLAEKYVTIGEELYLLRNFWGISQIILALNKTEAARLFKWNIDSWQYAKYLFLDRVVSPLEDFHAYNEQINSLEKGQHFLPLMTNLWRDLNLAFFEQRPDQINANWLSSVGNLLSVVQQWKKHCVYDIALIKGTRNFMEDIPNISEDVLQEFSIATEPWRMFADRYIRLAPTQKWTCADMVVFLQKNAMSDCICPLLRARIWSGGDLLDFLSNRDKINKRERLMAIGCPLEAANTIATLSKFWVEENNIDPEQKD